MRTVVMVAVWRRFGIEYQLKSLYSGNDREYLLEISISLIEVNHDARFSRGLSTSGGGTNQMAQGTNKFRRHICATDRAGM